MKANSLYVPPTQVALETSRNLCQELAGLLEGSSEILIAAIVTRDGDHQRHVQRISCHPRGLRFWIGDLSEDAKTCLGSMADGLLAEAGPAIEREETYQ